MQIYILNPDGKTLCNMSNDNDSIKAFNFHDSKFTCYLNSAEVFEFSCPTGQHEDSKYIQMGNHVIFKYGNDYHLFTITEIEDDHAEEHTIRVYCEGASMLLLNSVIHPSKTDSQTPEQALNIALATTDWRIGRVDVYGSKNIEFNYETVLEGVKRLCELYECDAQFRVEYSPQTGITGKYVDLLEHIGSFKGHRFEYGVNVSNVTRKVNSDNVVTAVIPTGNNDLNITNIECEVSRHGFNKPKGIAYVALAEEERAKIAQSPYHIFGTLQVDSDDAYTLALKAWEHLNENTEPQVEYSFNPVEMEFEAELGDDVYCIDRDLGLQLQARVSEKTVCFEDSSKNSITLINFEEKESDINLELINQIQSQLKDLEIDNNVIISDKMPTPETGKPITWVDTTPGADGKVTVQTWDGQQWLDHISGEYVDTVINQAKDEVKEEIQDEYTVYISQNTELPVFKQATQPERGIHNQLWLDISQTPNVWKKYNASTGEWEELITAGFDTTARDSISDIADEMENLKDEDARIYQEVVNTNEQLSSKLGKVEVETIVNDAILSLSGDGQNLLLYGACDGADYPKMMDAGGSVWNGLVPTLENNTLKIKMSAHSGYYVFGDWGLNGFLTDSYVFSFDIKIPSDSTITPNLIWLEFAGASTYNSYYLSDLTPISTSGEWSRYAVVGTFTSEDDTHRRVAIEVLGTSSTLDITNAYFLLDNLKVERGTEATAFTKNPNELTAAELSAIKSRVTKTESDIKQTQDSLSSYVTKAVYEADQAEVTETLESHNSQLVQTSEAIKAKVDTSTYTSDKNSMTEQLATHSAQIEANAKAITSKVSMTEVDNAINNIQIGGRNLLLKTATSKSYAGKNMMNQTAILYETVNGFNHGLHGKTVTLSYDYEVIGDAPTGIFYMQTSGGNYYHGFATLNVANSQSGRHKSTITFNSNTSQTFNAMGIRCDNLSSTTTIKISNMKLEIGNKATDWTPAPEDADTALNGLADRVVTAESQIVQHADLISQTVTKSTYETDKANTQNRLTTAESQIEQHADLISQTVTKTELDGAISNIQIGGVNLLQGTKDFSGDNQTNHKPTGDTYENCKIKYYKNTSESSTVDLSQWVDAVSLKPSAYYTLSFWCKGTGTFNSYLYKMSTKTVASGYNSSNQTTTAGDGSITTTLTSNWTRCWVVWKTRVDITTDPRSLLPVRLNPNSEIWLAGVKFELGNKATDWTPSPEDTDNQISNLGTRITTAESSIEQHADLIASKVSKTTYDVDMENLTSQIDSAETAIEQNADAITQRATKDEFNALGSRVSANEASITTMNNQISLKVNSSDFTSLEQTVGNELLDLETRMSNAEIKISDDKIASTVTSSSMFEVLMNKKADSEELGSFATLEELDSKLEGMNITGTIDERVEEMIKDGSSKLNLQFSTKAELNQTTTSINQNISMANGLNFLKNSGLHADWSNWKSWGGGITIKDCPELSKYGIGKCFSFTSGSAADNRGVYQEFQTEVGKTYTFSAYLKKTNKGTEGSGFDYAKLALEARNGSSNLGSIKTTTIADSRVTEGYEIITVIGVAKSATTRVVAGGGGNFTGAWAGFMCHEGSIPLKWTLASGEMYNTNVQTDINGIKVMRRDLNSNITGYTSITPDEFAGYYDTDGDGTMEKVFYLNDDETVTKKVRATNEITMGSIKIVNFSGGWAFVKTT